jgi:hypothetical protein
MPQLTNWTEKEIDGRDQAPKVLGRLKIPFGMLPLEAPQPRGDLSECCLTTRPRAWGVEYFGDVDILAGVP